MTTSEQSMTADELLRRPDDGFRYALMAGKLRQMPLAGIEESRVTANVAYTLGRHVRACGLGAAYAAGTGFLLSTGPDTVLAPVAAFVRRERMEMVDDVVGYWPGAPDLSVEIVSRHDLYTEIEEKVGAWLAAGTRMVIVVNPRQHRATVYRSLQEIAILTEDDTLDGGDVVPGWRMPVRELFV